MSHPALYLIPSTLGDTPVERVLPPYNTEIVSCLRFFIVENVRTARRFLKKCHAEIDIDGLTFFELNKHTDRNALSEFLQPLKEGKSMGIISEAGCPSVADPGAEIVALAHQEGYKVVPLVGPSSPLLALMASGFNGQCYAFNGYLPIDSNERAKVIKKLEMRAYNENQTQLFIETPYRNQKLAEDILLHCKPHTQLCIAMNLTCDDEYIATKTIKEWKNRLPDMNKKPCIFLLYKG
ncbi:SAM-dependent methyltransferase [Anaerorudis cellulosivorans]|uniref:SAM-dependent methyltransferase n=1 Tax=Anaerorudis cellulosivorans TaxID=3397862 RepID=UPI0022202F06|nr:SAM-dependent methyltransferase [Seramator thermalis]MCW1735790.1 SAM-dependent methyltransferase [Seramator thermalis]